MTEPSKRSRGEPSGERGVKWLDFERRPLLKALGVGGALSLGSGAVTASGDGSDLRRSGGADRDDGDETGNAKQIDPVFGYPTTDPADLPAALEPDYEVELHREIPDDPEDPEDPDHPSLFHFQPSGLQVDAGDVVQFTFTDPNHTVTAYHPDHGFQRRVPEDVTAFSAPIVQKDGAWLYRFEHEGLYDLYCSPHQIAGMAMRLVVGDLREEDVPDYEDTFETEPPLFPPLSPRFFERELNANSDRNENVEWVWPTDREVLDTDALNPMNIQEAGEVPFEEVADELNISFEPEENHD